MALGTRSRTILPACAGLLWLSFALLFSASTAVAAEHRIASPGGGLAVVVSDDGGLHYRVEVGGQAVVVDSPLGLGFKDGTQLGPTALITNVTRTGHDGSWRNDFGTRRTVPDRWREARLVLANGGGGARSRTFGLIVRAYDDGVAFRYDLPKGSGLGKFVLTDELTQVRFADNHRCWAGGESISAETQYPETTLSAIPRGKPKLPFRSVLPLLVETPAGYIAIAESDVLDWAGMSITGTGGPAVKMTLDPRADGNGWVVSSVPRRSPWRVLMFGRTAVDIAGSELVATLATPSTLRDASWIEPGASAWDAWWTGINPHDPAPEHRGVTARGTTASHKEYIDLAAEMGWRYQLLDWLWYKNMTSYDRSLLSPPNAERADFTQSVPDIDIPELIRYAKAKNVRLLIWAHSLDLETFGVERALELLARQGFAGVKIDFINSQSQEAVKWCERTLAIAAKHRLMIDFHGMYKPTGLARTYPNLITQEGVLGSEYNKFGQHQCTLRHTVTLPFTRGLLGAMDFTPGGFINRTPAAFKPSAVPTEVEGTRARQLAMTVVYPSPLLVLSDSPKNYRGQRGIDFLRDIPTVWDESVVVSAEVAKSMVVARRAGHRWYLAAMNGDAAAELSVPLSFLPAGAWTLRAFADQPDGSDAQAVIESTRAVNSGAVLRLSLATGGGFAGIISKTKTEPDKLEVPRDGRTPARGGRAR
jgi:alpha-glucosidase